jgi:8-oxo-dGTP diphosphatase
MEMKLPIDIKDKRLNLYLEDTCWAKSGKPINDRLIVRAIVLDGDKLVFAHIERHDAFADFGYLETSGGGVQKGEDLLTALKRELKEELGYEVEVICYLGQVIDYYNLIDRRNINNYFLVRKIKEVGNHLMEDEKNDFHLTPSKVTYEQAIASYKAINGKKIGTLLFNREVPVIRLAEYVIESYGLI